MNLYKISRTDDIGYDEYQAFVIAAANTEIAIKEAIDAMKTTSNTQEKDLQCEYIGTSYNTETTIILTDFNAG